VSYHFCVSRWQHLEGQGAVCFEADGGVRLVVSDEAAELVAQAERLGITADELVNRILDAAEADAQRLGLVAEGTGPIIRMSPPAWCPDYS
jgi:hypothetical protein